VKSKKYSHLSQEQRYQIEVLLQTGKSQKEISDLIKVSPSTISRELKRNIPKRGRGSGEYTARLAQRRTDVRHQVKPKRVKFTEAQKKQCRRLLKEEKYSPELISTVCRKTNADFVSHETIYQWIWASKASHHRDLRMDNDLYKALKHGCRRRKRGNRNDRRGIIPNRTGIENRPESINKRKRYGDMEADFVLGKNHKESILILLDRKSRKCWLSKLKTRKSERVGQMIRQRMACKKIKSITFDNDLGFAAHEVVAKQLGIKTYFTRPYSAQDKGSVENRIGILRRFIPKKTDLRTINAQALKIIESKLNNRPLKIFDYKTPNQLYSARKIALIT